MLLLSLILLGISLFSPFGHLKAISVPKDLSVSKPDNHRRSLNGTITEWTAMGDSYAAGIGAGSVIKPVAFYDICYRSDQSYPSDMQSGPTAFSPQPQTFNYLACSGATLPQILKTQLNDAPSGVYPAWGKAPEFATITMGGNDVGVKQLVLQCIYSWSFSFSTCDQIIKNSFATLGSADFQNNLVSVIDATQKKGVAANPNFHLYVTGYAQFFNNDTTQCNTVNFKPGWNPRSAENLTQDRRQNLNQIALHLNYALAAAVARFPPQVVSYVDYDAQFNGHRFCDRPEPDPNNPLTWFFSYNTVSDPDLRPLLNSIPAYVYYLNEAVNPGANNGSLPANDTISTDEALVNAVNAYVGDRSDPKKLALGQSLFRVFHPTSLGHQAIRGVLESAIGPVAPANSVAPATPVSLLRPAPSVVQAVPAIPRSSAAPVNSAAVS